MRSLEELFRENNLKDPDDIDALLELAEITGKLISDEQYSNMEILINYTISNEYYEALSWIMAALQEEYEKESCRLKDFTCFIGKSIANYDEFIHRLQVDLKAIDNDSETMIDRDGEVQSFFNILKYKTAYPNVFLITEENFDTKDNDFIWYKLQFKTDQWSKIVEILMIQKTEVIQIKGITWAALRWGLFSWFHQQSHPDFPATEPDDRVNGMAARAVHVAEVNPEKSAPLGGDAGG